MKPRTLFERSDCHNNRLKRIFSWLAVGGYVGAILAFLLSGNMPGAYIMLVFAVWLGVVFAVWKLWFVPNLERLHEPGEGDLFRRNLAYTAGAWAAVAVVLFGTFQYVDRGKDAGDASGLGKSFYKVGYEHPLVVFGIVVDNWWRYTLILTYQFTRSLIGAVLANFFWPWITNTIRNTDAKDMRLANAGDGIVAWYGFSQFCAQVFIYVSSVTDVFFALSQIDFLVMRWAIDAAVSWSSTTFFVTRRLKRDDEAQKPLVGRATRPGGAAMIL